MKTFVDKKETYITKKCIGITCDICGQKTNYESWVGEYGSYSYKDVEIKMKRKTVYPDGEGGPSEETSFDICPDCFEDKLVPFLESLGSVKTYIED